ncbi:MAG: hypothetical protein QOF62_1879 [Pyrinomonadaceae bacterium]|nr:hypothetical protein [Pyrinomonadaceae bacterium]
MSNAPCRTTRDSAISTKIYLGLIAFMVAVKVVFLLFPTVFPGADQEGAFSWTTILAIAVMGFIGLLLSRRTGFPEIWDSNVSNRQRFLIPAAIGIVYGLVTIIIDLRNPSPVHLKLPLSIPFYTYGALLLEIMLRLFTIPLLVWLFSNLILRGRWQTKVFWLAAIIAALYEPLPHMREQLNGVSGVAVFFVFIKWAIEPLFLANVLTGWLFRKYGFLAAFIMRLSFYLVWHIIYGGLISTAR